MKILACMRPTMLAAVFIVSFALGPPAQAAGCGEAHDPALPVNVGVVAPGESNWYDLDVPQGQTRSVALTSVFGRARLQILNGVTCGQVAGCGSTCSGIPLSQGVYALKISFAAGPVTAYVLSVT